MTKETLKEANYKYIEYLGNGQHVLKDKGSENLELWFTNKNHAGYGIIYKNTHLEFARTLN